MLPDFIIAHDIYILFLQEVTIADFPPLPGYRAHVNTDTNQRGAAIITRDTMRLDSLEMLPSGRGIAAWYAYVYCVNIYAPSGTSRRSEREAFFNTEIPCLLHMIPQNFSLGGDFNCFLTSLDSTGALNFSPALENLVRSLSIIDSWHPASARQIFTYYASQNASRIDRIHTSPSIVSQKRGSEVLPAAFTDHHAAVLPINLDVTQTSRRKGL
jgi:exonuclease III